MKAAGVTRKGFRFAFVIDSSWPDRTEMASIAEFEVLDAKGEHVPHDAWSFVSVSSEDTSLETQNWLVFCNHIAFCGQFLI